MTEKTAGEGVVMRVRGPVVEVAGLDGAAMLEFVEVGSRRLPGEVIALEGETATVQVYGYTGGLQPGESVKPSGGPLEAELGPGLIGGVFDGMLRRLEGAGDLLDPGGSAKSLSREKRWTFTPALQAGEQVVAGAALGRIPESAAVEHRILVPPGVAGRLEWIAGEGAYRLDETVAAVGETRLGLSHSWPVRRPRPAVRVPNAPEPLHTGQRVLDLLYPIARGSTAAVPGGFGTGKTLLLQQIAKWCDADIIVYVGCGERGNELADVLAELSQLEDPRTGQTLLDRTVIVANTSNMPVMAREASIHTGATVAEYYRDMGYETVLIADSTSRWAEALREVASRTGELPAEEGYPAGLAFALASFYERAGRVRTPAGEVASLTILGAVSPPGGDMTEPVTAHTRRFVRSVWSLDRNLAYARHYPAVSWSESFSRDVEALASWSAAQGNTSWVEQRAKAVHLLFEADRLEAVAQLVGAVSLPDRERIVLLAASLLREGVLQQNALSANDTHCSREKGTALLALVLDFYERCLGLVEHGVPVERILEVDLSDAVRVRDEAAPDDFDSVTAARASLMKRLEELAP